MQEYQQRVIEEQAELNFRIEKLYGFISGDLFCNLPADEQSRLILQSHLMNALSAVLLMRIAAFKKEI